MSRTRLQVAAERIRFARSYTRQYLSDLNEDEWFWTPPGFTTHIAWQVAHVASSQYGLCLFRVRGRTSEDEQLIPEGFWNSFRIGSTPVAGKENNPSIATIVQVFDRVQEQVLREIGEKSDKDLDVAPEKPHPAFDSLLGAIEYSPQHELVHAGQIALLRRLMGKPYLR